MPRQLTAVSLFSGAGGMDIGFEQAGYKIVVANEIMKDAAETYRANRPNCNLINDDINNVKDSFNDYVGTDIVFGGPPCQGFSVAGKMNPEDERSKLIFAYLDVVEAVRPKAFVMENVKALGALGKWEGVRNRYLEMASSLGYACVPFILNAVDYGVSQKRERVFFVGIRDCSDKEFATAMAGLINAERCNALTIKELFKDLGRAGSDKNPNTCTARITFASHPVMRKSPYAGMYFNGQGRPMDVDGYANTLPASMGGNKTPFVDEDYLFGDSSSDWVATYHKGLVDGTIKPEFKEAPKRLRRITLREAARIQTFPDDYIFKGNKGSIYTQIGNAVPCKLAYAVAKALRNYLESHS